MPVWQDIAATETDANSAVPYTLVDKMRVRHESLAEHPWQLDFAEVSQSGNTHPTFGSVLVTIPVRVPAAAKKLTVVLELKVSAGTGYVKGTLGSTDSAEASNGFTTYTALGFAWSDISAMRGTNQDLKFRVSNSAGGNTTFIRSINRATASWSFD